MVENLTYKYETLFDKKLNGYFLYFKPSLSREEFIHRILDAKGLLFGIGT